MIRRCGYSLGICWKQCERVIEWTRPSLSDGMAPCFYLRIDAIAERLMCSGAEGCKSREVAVFTHLFDGA